MLAIGKDEGKTSRRVKGKIKACRVEYETKDRTNWKAVVLAYCMEDAINYIRRSVQGFDRYISTSVVAEIDGIEDAIFDDFFVKKVTVVETVVETVQDKPVQNNEDLMLNCPWCDKSFISKVTLGSHIKRFHMEKDSK